MHIHPVILSGGSGTRLWPLSRTSYPKQFLRLAGDQTMLQATLTRANKLPGTQAPIVICNNEHRFLIREQCEAIKITPETIYLEPAARNTAPAIALAAFHLSQSDENAVMLVLPADHVIDDQTAFAEAVKTAILVAQEGYLATFGIVPHAPETGYQSCRSPTEPPLCPHNSAGAMLALGIPSGKSLPRMRTVTSPMGIFILPVLKTATFAPKTG